MDLTAPWHDFYLCVSLIGHHIRLKLLINERVWWLIKKVSFNGNALKVEVLNNDCETVFYLRYDDIEVMEDNCTSINVWSIGPSSPTVPRKFQLQGPKVESINIQKLVENLTGESSTKFEVQKLFVCLGKECEKSH